jgi:hypothetical protein
MKSLLKFTSKSKEKEVYDPVLSFQLTIFMSFAFLKIT